VRRALLSVALAALAGCGPQLSDPDEKRLTGRVRGGRVMTGGIIRHGRARGARIIASGEMRLGRVRRDKNVFDPEKAGRDVGSLAEWAMKRRGKEAAKAVPSPGSMPSAPPLRNASGKVVEYPPLDEMKPLIGAYLSSPDVRRRIAGAIAAAHHGERSAVPRLVELVRAGRIESVIAARALGAIGDARAAGVLREGVRAGGPMALVATDALGELRHRSAVGGLLEGLSSASYRVRISAARGLGRTGGRRARAALERTMNEKSELTEVRLAAAAALARTGSGDSALDLLLRHYASAVPERSAPALRGLALIDDPRATEALASGITFASAELWLTSLWGLITAASRPGPGAKRTQTQLERLATDRRAVVRDRAKLGLALAGAPGSGGYLVELLGSVDGAVRAEAAAALGFVGEEAPLGPLEHALASDPDVRVRRSAAAAIGRLGRPEGLTALSRALGSEDPVLRAVAMAGIANIRGGRIEKLAEPEAYTAAELARQAEHLRRFVLEGILESRGRPAVIIVSPEGRRRLYRKGDTVYAGFRVARIVRTGEGQPPATTGSILLEKADARVVLRGVP